MLRYVALPYFGVQSMANGRFRPVRPREAGEHAAHPLPVHAPDDCPPEYPRQLHPSWNRLHEDERLRHLRSLPYVLGRLPLSPSVRAVG